MKKKKKNPFKIFKIFFFVFLLYITFPLINPFLFKQKFKKNFQNPFHSLKYPSPAHKKT